MKKTEYIIIAVLLLIIAALTAGVVVSVQNNQTAKYELLYAQEHAKVALREKQIDSLEREKKTALSSATVLKLEKEAALFFADKYYGFAKDYKLKYEELRDSEVAGLNSFSVDTPVSIREKDSRFLEVIYFADSAIDAYEKEGEYLRESLLYCDSTIQKLEEAQGVTENQFLLSQLNNESKDKQINLQLKQLKSEKRKSIAIGTVGGFMIAGGIAGLITLAVMK